MKTRYKIICNDSLRTFEEIVQNHLDNGWKLQGNPFIDYSKDYCQAVIFESSDIN